MSARILIVDDEMIVIKSCLRILGGSDYHVEAAHDGRADIGRHGREMARSLMTLKRHYNDQVSYLNESATRVRNAMTFPSSTFMSILVTSATRRSRIEPAAVSTARRPASSHDFSLIPTTSTIR